MARYYYFKPSGKWAYDGEGVGIPREKWLEPLTHQFLKELNGGEMPGISNDGEDLFVIIIDEGSFPRFIYPRHSESLHDIMNIAYSKAAYGVK